MQKVVVGMVGAARGAELHVGGYKCVHGIDVRLKKIMGRRPEQVRPAKEKFGFEEDVYSFSDLLEDSEINVIDICTPPYTHSDMVIAALKAGKNVVCEKPLTGCFDTTLTKGQMLDKVRVTLTEISEALKTTGKRFMYAENFIYAPQIQRAAELLRTRKSKILYILGEESLKGSSSAVAGDWSKTGGGTLMRVGSHPLAAALYLKQIEATSRNEKIEVDSVISDCAMVTTKLSEYEHRAISARPKDVEDISTTVIAFSDGSRCSIIANDVLLGGSKTCVNLYCNDFVANCKLTLSDMMETYFPDDDNLENYELSEMLPVKTGWNKPFVSDDIIRGYAGEMQDFCECVAFDREAKSNFEVAYNTTIAMYAAYASAELNRRVQIKE